MSIRRAEVRYCIERSRCPFVVSMIPGANRSLHDAVPMRVVEQVRHVDNLSGDASGRSEVLGVFCETVDEVYGVTNSLWGIS